MFCLLRNHRKPQTGNPKLKTENRKPKTRLDQLLVARGLAKSRAQAQALILAGRVVVEGVALPKAGVLVPEAVRVTVKESAPFVSRGGEKLAGALDHFAVSPADKVALDTGASTGGFTDVLLTRGARRVYAVDVGYGQLDTTPQKRPPGGGAGAGEHPAPARRQPSPSPLTWPPWICPSSP